MPEFCNVLAWRSTIIAGISTHLSTWETDLNKWDARESLSIHGDALYRFALVKVRQVDVAEELVQETMLAAWRDRATFLGAAQERTWLLGIMRHKILDWLRLRVRERERRVELQPDDWLDEQFTPSGKWRRPPSDSLEKLESAELSLALRSCSEKLPARLREVITLWHFEDESTHDVCERLGIVPNHLGVLLHRARFRLWRCLSDRGLAPTPPETGASE
ncbi:MAG: sigma-70 family RNA polymerase sigma factor [Fimbriiglobus sp.]